MHSTQQLLKLFTQFPSVCTDTRSLKPEDLFFALKGDRFDGNQYALQALEQGAAWAIVSDSEIAKQHERCYLVPDTLRALQDLAKVYRLTFDIPVLGLTGSNGKTTTKELLYSVLATHFRTYATPGNFNNHIGVPLTLLGMPRDTEIAIVEMGSNQPGDIAELCDIARPSMGLITNIGDAHLEKLGDRIGVRNEKGALFAAVKAMQGLLFVNEADPHLCSLRGDYEPVRTYGTADSQVWMHIVEQSLHGMKIQVHHRDWSGPLDVHTPMSGGYNALNILAAITVGQEFGLRPTSIQAGIAAYQPTNNRSQVLQQGPYTIWLDAYNANPSSMEAAIRHLFAQPPGKVALVLGDMLELGPEGPGFHAQIGQLLQEFQPFVSIGIGPQMKHMVAAAPTPKYWFADTESALQQIPELIKGASLVLIKGSRGMALERVLDRLY